MQAYIKANFSTADVGSNLNFKILNSGSLKLKNLFVSQFHLTKFRINNISISKKNNQIFEMLKVEFPEPEKKVQYLHTL